MVSMSTEERLEASVFTLSQLRDELAHHEYCSRLCSDGSYHHWLVGVYRKAIRQRMEEELSWKQVGF